MAEETNQTTDTNSEAKGSNPVLMILIVGLLVVGGFYFYDQMSQSEVPVDEDVTDEEMLPEDVVVETEEVMMEPEMVPVENSIVDVAGNEGNLGTFLTALSAAGLAETFASEGEYTVFAPSDEAFNMLPAETLEGLLADPQALAEVLRYHVVSGKMNAEGLASQMEASSLQGGFLMFTVNPDGTVEVNGAKVVKADVDAENGVVHVIDTVLIPN